TCQAPVLEILSCAECGEPYLEGIESASRLTARLRNPPRDEFAFDSARESESESEETQGDEERASQPDEVTFVHERLFAANPTPSARDLCVDPKRDWRVLDQPCDGSVKLRAEEHFGSNACPHCHPVPRDGPDLLRPLRFGAPFILGNAAPVLLEGV